MSDEYAPPRGSALEQLLMEASADPALAEWLARDPLAAAAQHGLSLSPTEQAMLGAMEPERLQSLLEAMSASGVTPPGEPIAHVASLGIRDDQPPPGDPVCTGIRADPPPGSPVYTGIRADPPPPRDRVRPPEHDRVKGSRPSRRLVVVAAAAATVGAAGVGVTLLTSLGNRPDRPAKTAPASTGDAGVQDAAVDGGERPAPARDPGPPRKPNTE